MSGNRCLTFEEEAKLRRFFKTRGDRKALRDWAAMRVLLTTGMRISEFLSLSTGEATAAFRLGYLFVPAVRRKGEACDLTVHLVAGAGQAFHDLLALRLPAEAESPLVVGRHGDRLGVRAFQLGLKVWARLAGIDEGISPHWFRHAFAASVVGSSASENPTFVLARLSRLLGHSDPRSCMRYLTMSRESTTGGGAELVARAFPLRDVRMTPARVRREFGGRAAA
jgi:integrase/recombinase XerD